MTDRWETTDEFADRVGTGWHYQGGLPGDPGWVSDAARQYGLEFGIEANLLDDAASADGWEHHDPGYALKIRQIAQDWKGRIDDL
jgi:hypothetical protein